MRFADILKMCFDSLSRRKGRTILTVLGVFIGCTSIIVMVSIGAGMQESYDQMLKNMGDLSIIEVYRGYNQSTGTQTESKLDDKAVESFHEIAGVKAVMPKASLDGYNVGFKAGVATRPTGSILSALTRAPLRTWALSWWTGGIPKTATRWSWASILPITSPIR